jgi:hypothetical protein
MAAEVLRGFPTLFSFLIRVKATLRFKCGTATAIDPNELPRVRKVETFWRMQE